MGFYNYPIIHPSSIDDDRTDSQSIDVRLRWRMARWGFLEVNTFDRKVRGTSQRLDDTGFLGRFQWWFGAWYGSILYETLSQDEMFVEQIRDRDRVLIQVTRRFG